MGLFRIVINTQIHRENGGKNMKAINIDWDVDLEEDLDVLQMLPDEIEIPEELEDKEAISDYLSDVTGFCHNGFELVE
jgi:hypothetical protein